MENSATNATIASNPPYRWMGEPDQRGTFGIISFCSTTLIICTWSTLHFNIPIRRNTTIHRFVLQVTWMVLALLAPEFLLFLAINERTNAGVLVKKAMEFHPDLAKPGIPSRMYNWISGRAESKGERYDPIGPTHQPRFGLVHAFYAVMGGFAFHGSYDDEDTPSSLFEAPTNPRQTVDVLKFDGLMYIMRHFPRIVTDITEESILDRAESSSLGKAILIVQVGWFCTNCVSRLSQGLPLTLLEVSTAAHSLCTLLTYFVWWSKPVNIPTPTFLVGKEAREVYALLKCSENEYDEALEMARGRAAGDSSMPTAPHVSEKIVLAAGALQHLLPTPERPPHSSMFKGQNRVLIPGNTGNESSNATLYTYASAAVSPILYGLVHFVAWNDQFPTPLERLLWRVSSFVVSCSGLVEVLAVESTVWVEHRWKIVGSILYFLGGSIVLFVVPIAHVLASGFLIVESARQLLFLGDAAYQLPSWSNYWPHLS